jgi:hypothetical protein
MKSNIQWFMLLLSVNGCAQLQYQETLVRVAEKSYFYGCIYGADKVSFKYLECYQHVKEFSHDIRREHSQKEVLEYAKKYNIKPVSENKQ